MSQRRSLFTLVTGLALALAVCAIGTPAQASDFRQMNIFNSGHCLDNATQDDARLQMWSCSGASEQKWLRLYHSETDTFTLVNQRTGRCVEAPTLGSGTARMGVCQPDRPIQQWRILAADNPSGTPNGWYAVWKNLQNGFCLTTPTVANGTLVQVTTCDTEDPYDRWQQ